MEPRDRLIARVASLSQKTDTVAVDFGDLVRKLVLFEVVILDSIRLKEFPLLVNKFGYDSVIALLESDRLKILCDALSVGSLGQTKSLPPYGDLPLGSYCFRTINIADRKQYIHENLQTVHQLKDLSDKQNQKLRKLIADNLVEVPYGGGQKSMQQFTHDLESNNPVLKTSIRVSLEREFDHKLRENAFEFHVTRLDDSEWKTETNLADVLKVDELRAHKAVERGLLGVGGLNQRLEYMERYEALSGFQPSEVPIFESKLSFLSRQIDPDAQVNRLERVLSIPELPDVSPSPEVHDVDVKRLLKVTAGDEVKEFRQWLRTTDAMSEKEISSEIHKIRDAVGQAIRSKAGKSVRFASTTGLGLLGGVPGLVAGLLDTFLLDKIIPDAGPTAFLSNHYPSIFTVKPNSPKKVQSK